MGGVRRHSRTSSQVIDNTGVFIYFVAQEFESVVKNFELGLLVLLPGPQVNDLLIMQIKLIIEKTELLAFRGTAGQEEGESRARCYTPPFHHHFTPAKVGSIAVLKIKFLL